MDYFINIIHVFFFQVLYFLAVYEVCGLCVWGGNISFFEAVLCNKVSELIPRWTDTVR